MVNTKIRSVALVGALTIAGATTAQAFTFTLTPVTLTTPNYAGVIQVNGTVTMGAGETFYSPTVMSTAGMPFLSTFAAGFNGPGQAFDPTFLAWNGIGTYTGAIHDFMVNPGNLGYSSGMPLGLYDTNPLGPAGKAFLTLNAADAQGLTITATSKYAILVTQSVPEPCSMLALSVGGIALIRRRNLRK